MNNWQHLLSQNPDAAITGEWFCVRFSPDKTTGELFNIGVVFIDQDKQCHTKLLENTRVFEQKDLRKRVTSFIKKQLPDTYHHFLQDGPILLGNMSLDIPIVNHSLSKKFYGTVVSADFSNEVHFFYNVEHIGVSNLANCCEILGKDIKSGISIYNPPLESKAQQDERDEKIDKCLYRLERLRKNGHDIDIRIENDIDRSVFASLEMVA